MALLTSCQSTFYNINDAYSLTVLPDYIPIACDKDGKTLESKSVVINFGLYMGTERTATSVTVPNNLPEGISITDIVQATTTADGSMTVNIESGSAVGDKMTTSFKISVASLDGEFYIEKYITLVKSLIGATGESGANAIGFIIYSPDGDTLYNNSGSITLHTYAYDGLNEIINGNYQWYKGDQAIEGATSSTLIVNGEDVINIQTYKCILEYNSKTYNAYFTVRDFNDVYRSEILTIGGNVINSKNPYIISYVQLYKNEEEIDPLIGDILLDKGTASNEGHYYIIEDNMIQLKYYDGSNWIDATQNQEYKYNWYKIIGSNGHETYDMESKVALFTSQHISGSAAVECSVLESNNVISKCQTNVLDLNDPIVGTDPPSNPKPGQLWVDTSSSPYEIKIYNGEKWVLTKASDTNTNVFTAKPSIQLSDGYCYHKGDIWIVGDDYNITTNSNFKYSVMTMLVCNSDATTYSDSDWEEIYNSKIKDLEDRTQTIEDHVQIDENGSLRLNGTNVETGKIPFYAKLTSGDLGFYERGSDQGNEEEGTKVTWIGNKNMHAKETIIEGALAVVDSETAQTLKLSESLNPFIQIGDFKLQIESNGSLSIV